MFLNMMQDWAGWLLMLFSFSIVLMWKHVRSDTKLVHAIWFCIFMHHAVVFLNTYVGGVIGTEMDARSFHHYAVDISLLDEHVWDYASIRSGHAVYTDCLGLLYRFVGPSRFFGFHCERYLGLPIRTCRYCECMGGTSVK